MAFFQPHILWKDPLRWYQRAALVAWWLGQAVCAACLVVAIWLLAKTKFDSAHQASVAALLLAGFIAMIVGRVLLALATTRKRRRRRLYY
ncbi:MAG TPA: hypothetical protein VJR58_25655 [Vineibacter sp.]|nr:hypothetical protein [Vineibacter sp.]